MPGQDAGRRATGRTVLFVSHNMAAVRSLCTRCIVLDSGTIAATGNVASVVQSYMGDSISVACRTWEHNAPGDSKAALRSVRVTDQSGRPLPTARIDQQINIEVTYELFDSAIRATAIIHLLNEHGICLFASNDYNNRDWWDSPRAKGIVTATCHLPPNFLAEGTFSILAAVGSYNPSVIHGLERGAITFDVVDYTTCEGVRGCYAGNWPGVIRPMLEWTIVVERSTADGSVTAP